MEFAKRQYRSLTAILTFFSSSRTSAIEFVFFGDRAKYLQKYLYFCSVVEGQITGLNGQAGGCSQEVYGGWQDS